MVDGQNFYWKRRDLTDGSYYSVTNFNPGSSTPSIISAGYVRSPLKNDEYISRLVRVTMTNPPSLFSRAIASDGLIKLSGNAVIDGFNSKGYPRRWPPTRSPPIALPTVKSPPIQSNSKPSKSARPTSMGSFKLAANAISVAGGSVGDFDWSKINTGIQPGWSADDMHQDLGGQRAASNPTWQSPIYNNNGGSNVTILKTHLSAAQLTSYDQTRPMIVIGKAELWVRGNFNVTGQPTTGGYVYIAPGASLKRTSRGQRASREAVW